jgi:predicted RNA-binding protein with PUA-like domain
MNYWLIKSEPVKFPLSEMKRVGATLWDGVRNYQARNNLAAMKLGDLCLFYHSNEGKEIVGLVKVIKESYQDPTTDETAWLVVDVAFEEEFPKTITLTEIKAHPILQKMALVKNSRISVVPVTAEEFDLVICLTH